MEFDFLLWFVQVSGISSGHNSPVRSQRPSLDLLGTLLNSTTTTLERAAEERSLLVNKVRPYKSIQTSCYIVFPPSCMLYGLNASWSWWEVLQIRDINELSRQEVEEIILLCIGEDFASISDNIQRRCLSPYYFS